MTNPDRAFLPSSFPEPEWQLGVKGHRGWRITARRALWTPGSRPSCLGTQLIKAAASPVLIGALKGTRRQISCHGSSLTWWSPLSQSRGASFSPAGACEGPVVSEPLWVDELCHTAQAHVTCMNELKHWTLSVIQFAPVLQVSHSMTQSMEYSFPLKIQLFFYSISTGIVLSILIG